MASLYWIEESLLGLFPCLWMVGAVGMPWAFALLSRRDWRSYALVGALALALGPAWLTGWMLALGLVGAQLDLRLLTAEWILAGSAVIALLGVAFAWRRREESYPARLPAVPLAFDEKLIIALMVGAVVLRWIHTAFFPFTAYDALWVYGFQGRLYFLEGNIPNATGYYPPFLPLQFAYVQALIGAINDHAARMVLPLMHIGSILAAYLLGQRLLSRRVGLITAALWSLHPFVAQWSYRGDLEIPLAFSFTLAALFFLSAWRERDDAERRSRDAILAGVILGIALFTKPTAGGFIWGVLLLFAAELWRTRLDPLRWLPRFKVALWAGLACLPLGAVWYLRNILLGHEAITLPKAVWLTRALRSGDYLAPLIIAIAAAWLAVALRRKLSGRELALGSCGLALLLAGALASNPTFFPDRVDPPASYVRLEEALMMIAGLALAGYSLRRVMTGAISAQTAQWLRLAAWSLLLALPYFVTFFFSYSYHYRLGFAIVPLLCLPIAIALAQILDRERMQRWGALLRLAYAGLLFLLCLPGVLSVMTDVRWSSVWLLHEELDSDFKKYQVYNPSLMEVVLGLEDYLLEAEGEAIVLAPGEERLPFFFPQMQIIDAAVTTLDELEALGATHFVFGAKAREAYQDAGIDPQKTQLVAALGRHDLFEKVRSHYHGVLSYELYEVRDLDSRRALPSPFDSSNISRAMSTFGDRLQLYANGAYPEMIFKHTPITLELAWQALEKLDREYQFVLQLQEANGGKVVQEWNLQPAAHRHGYYSTMVWDEGELVNDRQILYLAEGTSRRHGINYVFALGVWDPLEERYLPLELDGVAAGEFYQLLGEHRLRS